MIANRSIGTNPPHSHARRATELFQIKSPVRKRATEPLPRAWSHGSASRRSFPHRDSPSPSGKRTSPRSRDGPLASAVTPFAPHLAEARSSAVLLLATAPLAGNAYEVVANEFRSGARGL